MAATHRCRSRYSTITAWIALLLVSNAVRLLDAQQNDRSRAQGAQSYDFVTIEVPNGSGQLGLTALNDINNRGDILGGFVASERFGFLLDRAGNLAAIECPFGFGGPLALSNSGAMVGWCEQSGFYISRDGEFVRLDVPGASLTQARGINERNQIVGYYTDALGNDHGFVWEAGTFLPVHLPGLTDVLTFPESINNHGEIVGSFVERACGCNQRGFVLNLHNGALTILEIPGIAAAFPAAINNRGEIAGDYVESLELGAPHHGFILERGVFTSVDVPFPGATITEISGINDRGEIVGRYLIPIGDGGFYNAGFVATPARGR